MVFPICGKVRQVAHWAHFQQRVSIMQIPTKARFLSAAEWQILEMVFGSSNLPFRHRILLTDGLGGGGAPFTIPTSLISAATIPAAIQSALAGLALTYLGGSDGILGRVQNATGFTGLFSAPGQLLGMINLGYLVNVGPGAYPDMTSNDANKELLVHELSHVWQGRNSRSSTTYVYNSIMHQCRASVGGSSRNGAYDYTPGQAWSTYNTEQQASIIEDWYKAGARGDHALFPYIRDYVRHGRT